MAAQGIENPYQFGFIGSSDTHTGAMSDDEANFFSKVGLLDGTPEMRGSVPASFLMRTVVKYSAPDFMKTVAGRDYLEMSTFSTWGCFGRRGSLGRRKYSGRPCMTHYAGRKRLPPVDRA